MQKRGIYAKIYSNLKRKEIIYVVKIDENREVY